MQLLISFTRHAAAFRRLAGALSLLVCVMPGHAETEWDIVGLKIGMTEAEVRAAFQAYAPDGKIFEHTGTFSYSDNVNQFKSPAFLDQLELRVTGMAIQTPLRVWFSGPTGEPRVIAIARQENNLPDPVTSAEFQQNLLAKYGQPTGEAGGTLLFWEQTDKPSCIRTSYGVTIREFGKFPMGHTNVSQAIQQLEAAQQSASDPLPEDLATCGKFVYYTTGMNPVKAFMAGLFDVGAMAATYRARNEWVDSLEAEAIRKRESAGQAPRL
jgi:hypothetical protein